MIVNIHHLADGAYGSAVGRAYGARATFGAVKSFIKYTMPGRICTPDGSGRNYQSNPHCRAQHDISIKDKFCSRRHTGKYTTMAL